MTNHDGRRPPQRNRCREKTRQDLTPGRDPGNEREGRCRKKGRRAIWRREPRKEIPCKLVPECEGYMQHLGEGKRKGALGLVLEKLLEALNKRTFGNLM